MAWNSNRPVVLITLPFVSRARPESNID